MSGGAFGVVCYARGEPTLNTGMEARSLIPRSTVVGALSLVTLVWAYLLLIRKHSAKHVGALWVRV